MLLIQLHSTNTKLIGNKNLPHEGERADAQNTEERAINEL